MTKFDYFWTEDELKNLEAYLTKNPKSPLYNTMEDYLYALKAEKEDKLVRGNYTKDPFKYSPEYDHPPYKNPEKVELKGNPDYHFQEGKYIEEFKKYVDSTYSKDYHYVGKGGTQATDLIIDSGHGKGFCVGNIVKYASRAGKKDGQARKDILKILHYALILLHVHDSEGE